MDLVMCLLPFWHSLWLEIRHFEVGTLLCTICCLFVLSNVKVYWLTTNYLCRRNGCIQWKSNELFINLDSLHSITTCTFSAKRYCSDNNFLIFPHLQLGKRATCEISYIFFHKIQNLWSSFVWHWTLCTSEISLSHLLNFKLKFIVYEQLNIYQHWV